MMCKFEHENVLGLLGISLDKLLRFVKKVYTVKIPIKKPFFFQFFDKMAFH